MIIKPKLAYRHPCVPTNQMDTNTEYEATMAVNQPDWLAKKKIFAGEHLLEEGEYTIVEGTFPTIEKMREQCIDVDCQNLGDNGFNSKKEVERYYNKTGNERIALIYQDYYD